MAKIEALEGESRMECTPDPSLRCTGLLLLPWSRIVWEVRVSDLSNGGTIEVMRLFGPNAHRHE